MTVPEYKVACQHEAAHPVQHLPDPCLPRLQRLSLTPDQRRDREARWEIQEAARQADARRAEEMQLSRRRDHAETYLRKTFSKRAVKWVEANPDADWPDRTVYPRVLTALSQLRSVLMLGSFGPGKTTIATKACLHLARTDGVFSRYTTAADLVSDFRYVCWEQRAMSEGSYLDRIASVPVLVIDEFNERGETQDETSKLARIIDRRYRAMVSTFVISNLTIEQFKETQHEGLCDRLRGSADVIVCKWKSFREPESE